MIDYTGLLRPYEINRGLRENDYKNAIRKDMRLEVVPNIDLSTIRLNSSFLEIAGKFFDNKGKLTLWSMVTALLLAAAIAFGLYSTVVVYDRANIYVLSLMFAALTLAEIALLAFVVRTFFRESFRLTHYPIRLNRRSRKVYVFDPITSKVDRYEWTKIFFTAQKTRNSLGRLRAWEVVGLTVDENQMVRKVIPFSPPYLNRGEALQFWEYLRRYMEEGPESVFDYTPICMPIADKKESYWLGFSILGRDDLSIPGISAIMSLFSLAEAAGRYIANATSKIPAWPKDIEAECKVDPQDPYAIDASDNPTDIKKAIGKKRSELIKTGLVKR